MNYAVKRLDKSGFTGDAVGAEADFSAPCVFTLNRALVVCGFFLNLIFDMEIINCVYYYNSLLFKNHSGNYFAFVIYLERWGAS